MTKDQLNHQNRIIEHFSHKTTPNNTVHTTKSQDNSIPSNRMSKTDSMFLISMGAEADDLAARHNNLIDYTQGLIDKINALRAISATK